MLTLLLVLAATSIDADVERSLKRSLPSRYELVDVTVADGLRGNVLSARLLASPQPGSNRVVVTLRTGGEIVKRPGIAQLRARARVLVARRSLPRGHVLTEKDLGYRLHAGEGLSLDRRALVGQRLTAPTFAGQFLSTDHVELPKAKPAGTAVSVRYEGGQDAGQLVVATVPGERSRVRVGDRVLPGTLVDGQTFWLERR